MSTLESEPWALFTYHYLEVVAPVQGIVHPGMTLPILVGQSICFFWISWPFLLMNTPILTGSTPPEPEHYPNLGPSWVHHWPCHGRNHASNARSQSLRVTVQGLCLVENGSQATLSETPDTPNPHILRHTQIIRSISRFATLFSWISVTHFQSYIPASCAEPQNASVHLCCEGIQCVVADMLVKRP